MVGREELRFINALLEVNLGRLQGGTHGQIFLGACIMYIFDSEPDKLGSLPEASRTNSTPNNVVFHTVIKYELIIFFQQIFVHNYFICIVGLGSRVFLAPWSRSRLKKKPGAGAAWIKCQEPETLNNQPAPQPCEKIKSIRKLCFSYSSLGKIVVFMI